MVLDAGAVEVAQPRHLPGLRLLVERHVQRRHAQLVCRAADAGGMKACVAVTLLPDIRV